MTTPGRRVPDGTLRWKFAPGDYSKTIGDPTVWYCRCPPPDHRETGNLTGHDVVEHDDGTITVSPSILIHPHDLSPGWHGWLERGVWREA